MEIYNQVSCVKISQSLAKILKILTVFDETSDQKDIDHAKFWQKLTAKEVELTILEFDPDQINLRQSLVEKFNLDYISGVHEGLAWGVSKEGYQILIDAAERTVIKTFRDVHHAVAYPFVNGVSFVKNDQSFYRIVDRKGEAAPVLVEMLRSVTPDSQRDGIFAGRLVGNSKTEFFFDASGQTLFDKVGYKITTPFENGRAWAEKEKGEIVLLDKATMTEKMIKGIRKIVRYSDGVAWVVKSTKGMLDAAYDSDGNELFTGNYQEIRPFSEGLAVVKMKDQWYFLDHSGKTVLGPYEEAGDFQCGRAWVSETKFRRKTSYFIDKNGQPIGGEFRQTYGFSEEVAAAKPFGSNSYVLVDINGTASEKLVEIEEIHTPFEDGVAVATDSFGRVIHIDKKGKIIFEKNGNKEYFESK
ncbi:MAG: WG repeat-containing protein [Candidatus Berkelbacteria bacterium]|nr:WG repeat-containing protein [Candidatus Berkelbacteria bacterium]